MTGLAGLAFPTFRPRPPWWGGDLQTLRNTLTRTAVDLSPWRAARVMFDLDDGDRLTLVLHAGDDPWVPSGAHLRVDWETNSDIRPLLTASGGHCGFHATGHPVPWHDRCAVQLFKTVAG